MRTRCGDLARAPLVSERLLMSLCMPSSGVQQSVKEARQLSAVASGWGVEETADGSRLGWWRWGLEVVVRRVC
jgi:hypothetical protein